MWKKLSHLLWQSRILYECRRYKIQVYWYFKLMAQLMLNFSKGLRGKGSCINKQWRESVNGLRERMALKYVWLLSKHFGIDVLYFLEGECLSRSHSTLLHHFFDSKGFLDVKFRINFRVIDLVSVHSLLESEIMVHGHIEKLQLYRSKAQYPWRVQRSIRLCWSKFCSFYMIDN